ncbi:hypothetical protein [Variovorax paradoxus]|uniref:hypothetical protein n=1 Tax=Variovorax paradoxus TaxID=34073 RepID=UPI00285A11B9|nr:hypothetical protein [Variovorax paradoxus]MDR6455524.1 hypothetical protein [Variovorax paradoxus]
MSKLTYPTIAALIADFKAGAKFEITGSSNGNDGPVISMVHDFGRVRATVVRPDRPGGRGSQTFDREGKGLNHLRLLKVADAPAAPAPFLKRFVLGEPAYCPKTRETVKAVEFVNGAINVTLVNGDGIERVSTSYDHDGKHHWVKERSLVIGELPPTVKPDVKVEVYLFESKGQPGIFRAFTLGEQCDYRLWRQVGYSQVVAQGRQRG